MASRSTKALTRYPWACSGDINAFFGLMLDNVSDLVIFASILIGVFGMPEYVVLTRMVPGSAVAVLVGDLIFTAMAFRLAHRTGRKDVTAMPLGLDTPSTIAFALTILGPAYKIFEGQGMSPDAAAIRVWHLGMAVMVFAGLLKMGGAFVGRAIRRVMPRAGLLGSIAAVALVLIAFLPSLEIFHNPIVGFASLGIILVAFIAKHRLPFKLPGAFAAVLAGVVIYYGLGALPFDIPGITGFKAPDLGWHISFPAPTLTFWQGVGDCLIFLPIVIPFTLAIVIGGIDVTESAAATGDHYDTRAVIFSDGVATLIAGLCGGVIQSTPYIGHPAYKDMGGRAAYTLAAALFIGAGGVFGYLAFVINAIPEAAVAPILVFIGLEITSQAFEASPSRHAKAVAICFLPVMANLVVIELNQLLGALQTSAEAIHGEFANTYQILVMLGNGFIISALLWGSMTADLIDANFRRASAFAWIAGVMSLFGVIHSPRITGALFWPWEADSAYPFTFAAAYALLSLLFLAIGRNNPIPGSFQEPD